MPEMKMLIWKALWAMAAGTASQISLRISGVRRGRRTSTRAPDLRTPHHSSPACDRPATITPQDAAKAAPRALCWGSTAIRVTTLSSIGAAAPTMKRPRAFSTPDRWA